MTDDQGVESLRVMPVVRDRIGARGVSFENSFVNWPLCCPSRATFLTGQYAHNHGVLGNAAPLGGFDRLDSSKTLPVWLQRSGYFTAHVGKYLNGYEQSAVGVPAGWSEWHGSKATYTYYGYQLLEDGMLNTYGSRGENPDSPADPRSYSSHVYTDKAVDLIARRAPRRRPFFLSLSYLAVHAGGPNSLEGRPPVRCQGAPKPAVEDLGALAGEPLPAPPSFNEADVSDKPAEYRNRPRFTAEEIETLHRYYECELESLLAVDRGVARVLAALRAAGELDNTLIVFTSDNGFLHGEHRSAGKNQVYEEAIRVPLLIRGPGVPRGETTKDLATNADLAATILEVAGARPGLALDGRSLVPALRNPGRERGRELLIEQEEHQVGAPTEQVAGEYTAIRNARYIYVEHGTGEQELYDLETDPFQLQSQHDNPAFASLRAELARRLAILRECAGAGCRRRPALKLALRPASRSDGGGRCRPPPIGARLAGDAAAEVTEALFRVGDDVVERDRSAPFSVRLSRRELGGQPRAELRVIADLFDGRLASVQKRVRICG